MSSAPEPQLLLAGDRVALGPLRRDLVPSYARWFNELDVRRGTVNVAIKTEESEAEWFERAAQAGSGRDPSEAHFTVYDRRDLEPVGLSGLLEISHRLGRATFGIMLGERRGQGLGADATRLTLDWAFNVVGLRNMLLETFSWNEPAMRAYRRAGFREIGQRRQSVVFMGRRCDTVLMDAIPADLSASVVSNLRP